MEHLAVIRRAEKLLPLALVRMFACLDSAISIEPDKEIPRLAASEEAMRWHAVVSWCEKLLPPLPEPPHEDFEDF